MTTRPDYSHSRVSRDIILPDRVINIQQKPKDRKFIEDQLIGAKEKYIYHIILSSGDKSMSPKDVELWAKAVLQSQKIDKYYMVVHAGDKGHTENPHAHTVVRTDTKFDRSELFEMRKSGDLEQKFHRQLFRGMEEAWRERAGSKDTASGTDLREPENNEEKQSKKRGVDIQFE